MTLRENTLLQNGKYRIVRFISSGGFGCTYEAVHVMLGKRVAIKEFFVKDFCNRDEASSRVTVATASKRPLIDKLKRKFIEEAIALSQLDHPHIIRVYDVFEEYDTAYYVMEYIDGHTLAGLIKNTDTITVEDTIGYVKQLCPALAYIHANNRLHLDIKPSNIMVRANGQVVLIDFGTSRQYEEEAGENTSALTGRTPGYAPIEQMGHHVTKFTPSADIYALGATMVKMLTGVTPPDATVIEEIGIPKLPETVSVPIKGAIFASLQHKRADRPQSIAEFLEYLDGKRQFDITKGSIREADDSTLIDPQPSDGSKDKLIKELQAKVKKLEKDHKRVLQIIKFHDNESHLQEEEYDRQLKWRAIIILVLLISCGLAIGAFWAAHNRANKLNDKLLLSRSQVDSLTTNVAALKTQLDTLKSAPPLVIGSFEVRNLEDKYGDAIYSETSTYLKPRLNIISWLPDGEYEILYRIYDSNGKMRSGDESPVGYTYGTKFKLKQYQPNIIEFLGWGGKDKGWWNPGKYRYEFYFQDECIGRYDFQIH